MIPKIIHYVWVGNKEKPELVQKCITSWKKFCPDYQIIEWGNDSLNDIDNAYVKEAYQSQKWAFVSDYLRLYALNKYGGVYFDTDLELTQNIDEFLNHSFFTGFENWEGQYSPITALMGAEKESKIISDLLAEYNHIHFIKNGNIDLTTNTSRITKYFKENYNLTVTNDYSDTKETKLSERDIIYPSYYFCTPQNNKKNYSIHHFNGSWRDPYKRKNIFRLADYTFVRYKKRKEVNGDYLPLFPNEKNIITFAISSSTKWAIIKGI